MLSFQPLWLKGAAPLPPCLKRWPPFSLCLFCCLSQIHLSLSLHTTTPSHPKLDRPSMAIKVITYLFSSSSVGSFNLSSRFVYWNMNYICARNSLYPSQPPWPPISIVAELFYASSSSGKWPKQLFLLHCLSVVNLYVSDLLFCFMCEVSSWVSLQLPFSWKTIFLSNWG